MIPPLPPTFPQNPLKNLPGTIRQHLKTRGIWQTHGGGYALNDGVSLQVRSDTLRFRIEKKHRIGI